MSATIPADTDRRADAFAYRPVRWPLRLAVGALIAGLAMLAAATWTFTQAHRLAAAAAARESINANLTLTSTAVADPESTLPVLAQHGEDLQKLFRLAGQTGLTLGAVDYRTEDDPRSGVLLKHIVLHVDDDYPKLKGFLAALLRILPHCRLDAMQIEQTSGAPAGRLRATVKLALVYRSGNSPTGLLTTGGSR